MQKTFTLTKKIAKHGDNSIIVIPKFLNKELSPRTVVEVKISVLKKEDKHDSK